MINKIRIISLVVICLTALTILAIRVSPKWADALATHTLVQKDGSRLELLWVQTIFNPGFTARQLAATAGELFFVGSLSRNGDYALVTLESESGHKLWQVPLATTVDVDSEMVYVDYRDSVVAYDLNGERIWRTTLPARNISFIDAVEGKLYVGAGGYYLLDAATGALLASSPLNDIFVGSFSPKLFSSIWGTPAFLERRVFTRALGMDFSAALALDRQSGDILWRTADNVISNITATESLAFVITYGDELQVLNASTGKLMEMIQIEPSINFFTEETQRYHRIYQLTVDQTHQILYVFLGDSNQLFAFKINN